MASVAIKRSPIKKRPASSFSDAELDSILKSQGRYPGQSGAGMILERSKKPAVPMSKAKRDSSYVEQMKKRRDTA